MSSPSQLLLFEEPVHRSTVLENARKDTALQMCVLGSGSSGNSTVIRNGDSAMLIDAGFGPRATARRLSDIGLTLDDINAICLTHLDRDHFNPNWIATLCRESISVYVHSRHVHSMYRGEGARQQ